MTDVRFDKTIGGLFLKRITWVGESQRLWTKIITVNQQMPCHKNIDMLR